MSRAKKRRTVEFRAWQSVESRRYLQRDQPHGRVVNENTTLLHHFFNMSQTERVGHVSAYANKYDFQWVMKALEDLTQGAVDQTLAEIKHRWDCRSCLS